MFYFNKSDAPLLLAALGKDSDFLHPHMHAHKHVSLLNYIMGVWWEYRRVQLKVIVGVYSSVYWRHAKI